MAPDVDLRIPSDPRWLRLVRLVAERYCLESELGHASSREMVLALAEAVSNVMRHAYLGDATGPIQIVCRRSRDSLEIEVGDRGRKFDPLAQPLPRPDELRSGGRGIFIIQSSADECSYRRDGEWNRLRLRKMLPIPSGERGQ